MRTFEDLIHVVTAGANEQGIDVSAKDVGWIVSTFIEGVVNAPGEMHPALVKFLQTVADEAAAVRS